METEYTRINALLDCFMLWSDIAANNLDDKAKSIVWVENGGYLTYHSNGCPAYSCPACRYITQIGCFCLSHYPRYPPVSARPSQV